MENYTEEFLIIDDVMHIKLRGKFPVAVLNSNKNAFLPVIEKCLENACSKIIIDIRDLVINLSVVELHKAGADAAFLSWRGLKVVAVARKETVSSFFDTVAFNRGGRVRVFTDWDEAMEWLNS